MDQGATLNARKTGISLLFELNKNLFVLLLSHTKIVQIDVRLMRAEQRNDEFIAQLEG